MSNHARIAVVILAVVVSAASATAPRKHSVQQAWTVPATYDATWTALVEVFAEHNWTISNIDRHAGFITTDWIAIPNNSTFTDCGDPGLAPQLGTEIRFNVFVKDVEGNARVTVSTASRQLRGHGNNKAFAECTSKGVVERQIHQQLAARAPGTKPRPLTDQAVPAVASRFHCTAAPLDPMRAACARSAAGCAKRQADIVEAVGDATPCVEATTAVCFIGTAADGTATESCHPSAEACGRYQANASADRARFADVTACNQAR